MPDLTLSTNSPQTCWAVLSEAKAESPLRLFSFPDPVYHLLQRHNYPFAV